MSASQTSPSNSFILYALVVACLVFLMIPAEAYSFPPTRAAVKKLKVLPVQAVAFVPTLFVPMSPILLYNVGKTSHSHDSITELSFMSIIADFFGNITITPDTKTALSQIVSANSAVDDDQITAAKHFDSENFPEGQQLLLQLQAEIVKLATSGEYIGSRIFLGQALHAIQDFYSHSNWIELGNTRPHPDLGKPGRILTRLPSDVPTCKNGILITTKLTSGYYSTQGPIPPHKCAHGEPTKGMGISKDLGIYTFGVLPRFTLHKKAAHMAVEASRQFIWELRSLLPDDAMKGVLGVSGSIPMLPRP